MSEFSTKLGRGEDDCSLSSRMIVCDSPCETCMWWGFTTSFLTSHLLHFSFQPKLFLLLTFVELEVWGIIVTPLQHCKHMDQWEKQGSDQEKYCRKCRKSPSCIHVVPSFFSSHFLVFFFLCLTLPFLLLNFSEFFSALLSSSIHPNPDQLSLAK
jgi:hypothetical protein